MKLILLSPQTKPESWCQQALEAYSTKIQHFVHFEVLKPKVKKFDRDSAEKKRSFESEVLLENIAPTDYAVLFDETGKALNTDQFSKLIENRFVGNHRRLVFIVGGAYGVSEALKKRAQEKLLLAPFTLNHWVAQVVALEQIYRAFTIIKGLPYHNH